MRKLIVSMLIASAIAAPAAAQRQHSWGDDNQSRSEARESRQQAREERQQARDESRQSRQEQVQARQEAQQQSRTEALAARSQSNDRNVGFRGNANQGGTRAHAEGRASRADLEAIRAARLAQSQSADTTHQWSSPEAEQRNRALRQHSSGSGTLRQSDREVPRTFRNRVPVVSDTPREGTQPPLRVRSRDHATQNWSTRWRYDGRYDWQNYRNRHRSLFRLGYYYDPFGWNYQPYDIGWRLWPSYYSSRYWISDPWEYRLPYAPPGYRWIRYFDDAILVDTWTGQVADVIYNFFW